MGKVFFGMTNRAIYGSAYVLLENSYRFQLLAIRGFQVQVKLSARDVGLHKKTIDIVQFSLKRLFDIAFDLVAAQPNRRTDSDFEVPGSAPEGHLKLLHSSSSNLPKCSPPAGMDRRDGAGFGINYQNWDAISRQDGKSNSRCLCNGSIALSEWRCRPGIGDLNNLFGMGLSHPKKDESVCSDSRKKHFSIRGNRFSRVVYRESKVQ
jgi:hypothetical protein